MTIAKPLPIESLEWEQIKSESNLEYGVRLRKDNGTYELWNNSTKPCEWRLYFFAKYISTHLGNFSMAIIAQEFARKHDPNQY